MKPALLRHLLCPACGGALTCTILQQKPVILTAAEQQVLAQRQLDIAEYQTEIMTGHLDCARCNLASPIREGVPRLYKGADRDWPLPTEAGLSTDSLARFKDDKNVQTTFSREWADFDYDKKTIWHWTLEERIATFCEEVEIDSPEVLRGKLMVDGGCGSGILSMNLAERYGVEIIAVDLSFILSRAFQNNRSNLCHFVQCSVLALPLRPGIADLTYSHGVLHHTESTEKAFTSIQRVTRPGGLLYVWLYGRKHGWNRVKYGVIRTIRGVNARLPRIPQMIIIYLLAGMHVVIRALKRLVGMRVEPIESLSQLLVITRDRYTPKHAREHTEAEVRSWFEQHGYTGITRRTTWQTIKVWNGSTDLAIRGVRPA